MSMKIPLTPAGIEPATFRIVARHLNHCATAELLSIAEKIKSQSVLKCGSKLVNDNSGNSLKFRVSMRNLLSNIDH